MLPMPLIDLRPLDQSSQQPLQELQIAATSRN
jgi:hypothetical protein